MLALYRSGRQADTLAAYRVARRTLADRLHTEPSQDLQRLEQAILAEDPALDRLALVRSGTARVEPPGQGAPAAAGAEPGEDRRLVTVLVCDVAESGSLLGAGLAEQEPEEAGLRLAARLTLVRTEIEVHGGTVEQVVGGTAMAVFGLDEAGSDHPERAVRAALAARAALAQGDAGTQAGAPAVLGPYAEPARSRPPLRAVVATGEVVVRPPGEGATAGRVSGDLVTLCFRLREAAPPGAVLVTGAVERATARAVGYGPASLVAVRGRVAPLVVWSALEPRVGADTGAAETELVGREQELARLGDWVTRVRRHRFPHMVTIVGPPGIGKSRLLAELQRTLQAGDEPIAWYQGGSPPYGRDAICAALAEMVKAGAAILDSDPGEVAERKLARAVAATLGDPVTGEPGARGGGDDPTRTGRDAAWVLGHLRRLVGLGGAGTLHAGQRGEVFAAWRRFVYGLAARRPLVLAVEDLQWADDALLDFLAGLVDPETMDRSGPTPVLVVATARPELAERRAEWVEKRRNAGVVELGPLRVDETERLLGALLERHGPPGLDLAGAVGGNPLLAEQAVRMLREQETSEQGSRGERAAPEGQLSVEAVVAARLEGLSKDERAVLEDLAVLGSAGWVGALAAVGGGDRAEVAARLEQLEGRELLRRAGRSRVAGEREHRFAHELVRDAVYARLPEAERARRHERAAAWLGSLGQGRERDRAELLVHHHRAAMRGGPGTGEVAERARLALRAAGDRAAALGVFTAAARRYAEALALWPGDDPERPELAFGLAKARFYAEDAGEDAAGLPGGGGAGADLVAARDALLAVGARARAAEAEELLARWALDRGQPEQLKGHLSRALALVREAQPSRSKATTLYVCALQCMIVGRTGEALAAAGEALAIARRLRLRDLEAHALCALGTTRVDAGDPGGVEDLESGMEVLAQLSSPETIYGYFHLAYAYARLGDVVRAAATVMAGHNAADRLGSVQLLRWMRFENVIGEFWLGLWDDVEAAMGQLETRTRASHYLEVPCRVVRGLVRLARGELDGATADSEVALAMADAWGDGHTPAVARAFRARVLLAAGRRDEAAELAGELLEQLRPGLLEVTLGADFGVTLVELGHTAEALDGKSLAPSRWLDALRALLAGDEVRAADLYAEIGSRPDEALARLRAGRRLLDAGEPDSAGEQLEVAVAFWREVGAAAYLAEAEPLLAAAGHRRFN
jgi:class 3 adenylate cyclase/tetratricopeptide (TPR) repeat protein